jgi:hypothetical protein
MTPQTEMAVQAVADYCQLYGISRRFRNELYELTNENWRKH